MMLIRIDGEDVHPGMAGALSRSAMVGTVPGWTVVVAAYVVPVGMPELISLSGGISVRDAESEARPPAGWEPAGAEGEAGVLATEAEADTEPLGAAVALDEAAVSCRLRCAWRGLIPCALAAPMAAKRATNACSFSIAEKRVECAKAR